MEQQVELTKEEREALRQVLEYLWSDERKRYVSAPAAEKKGHIWRSLAVLDKLERRTRK